MKIRLLVGLVLGTLVGSTAVAQDLKTIPETAVAAGQFGTLVEAVKAAGLLETLSGKGPFTVLAPNDDAFAKLPEGTVESLLKPENKDQLIAILKLHVASGRLTSDMAEPNGQFPTIANKPLKVTVDGAEISVGGAKVVKADIKCSNGVIHVIDSVILPAAKPVTAKDLVGTWVYTSEVKDGDVKGAEALAGQSVEVTEKNWTLMGDAKFVMEYTIDTKVTPNTIKYTITESPFGGGVSATGVIKMEGDELVVCYPPAGGNSPKDFKAEAGSGLHLFKLKKK